MNSDSDSPTTIDADVRRGLERLSDLLLPGTDTMPSGREVDADTTQLDRALVADPTLREVVLDFARRAAAADPFDLVTMQAWSSENDCERVVFALTAAYYQAPLARKAIGYPGQERRPIADATPDEVVTDELLAPVRERGQIFVPTPK